MGTLPYTKKMVLDFKYSSVLVFITCIFTMPAALLYGMRELFTFVACQMLNFVYKLAIRVYKSEKYCILHSKHTELYYTTDVKSEF